MSQMVSDFRTEMARGELSMLRKWIFSEELNLIKSFIKLSIPETMIEPALRVFWTFMVSETKLSCQNHLLSLEIELLAEKPKAWRVQEITEDIKETQLSLQNFELEPVKQRILSQEEMRITKQDLAKNRYLQTTFCYLEQEVENAEKRHLRILAEKEAEQAKHGEKKA